MPRQASEGKLTGPRGQRWLWAGSALWLVTIITGLGWMAKYSLTPGAAEPARVAWPEGSRIQRAASRPTLLFFAHPRCPCTRASLEELARLAAYAEGRFTGQVWFTKPAEVAADWTQTDLWRAARAIPGISVHEDEEGREAARFGAQTSGLALLYDPAGRLQFQGGITLARGHAGDNPGRSALADLLVNGETRTDTTPVFGCGLFATAPAEGVTP